jgi:membrane associated rhomboid family serine protease
VPSSREPIFNVPAIVLALAAVMVGVHVLFEFGLTPQQETRLLVLFAFIPGRYQLAVLAGEGWVDGWGAAVWTFVTYAFIHGGLTHLLFNLLWLLAFGTPVARRFGPFRFLLFFAVTAAAGALAHLVTHWGAMVPMVGASASIAGAMAAALRFVFQARGPLGLLGSGDDAAYRVPAAPLAVMLRDPRALAFVLVWFGLNLLLGLGTISMPGVDEGIAWQAHIGGFLVGLFAFSLFDPVGHAAAAPTAPADEPTLH